MKFLNLRLSLLAFGTVAALVSTSAHAVWSFESTATTGIQNYQKCSLNTSTAACDNKVGTTSTYVDESGTKLNNTTLSLSGFSVSSALDANGKLTGNWTSATLAHQGESMGWGMYTGTDSGSPQHALDNNGTVEAVLLNFGGSSVALTSIGIGYTSDNNSATTNDKVDISLFRWTGSAAGPTLANTAAGTMTGWELVGNYGDIGVDKTEAYNTVNVGGKTSSWWLISAYSSGFAQSAGRVQSSTESFDNGNDYFKLFAVAGNVVSPSTGKLPEPASLALTSVALLGVAGLRRRSKAKLAA